MQKLDTGGNVLESKIWGGGAQYNRRLLLSRPVRIGEQLNNNNHTPDTMVLATLEEEQPGTIKYQIRLASSAYLEADKL
jgi:hypothetical protein